MEQFTLYFPFKPRPMYIFELEKRGSGATTITENKIRF